jgi:hypothetical protein
VKNTDPAEEKEYDGGGKISGIKRHIGVDITGLPHAIEVTPANVTDRAGAVEAIENNKEHLGSSRDGVGKGRREKGKKIKFSAEEEDS